MRSPPRPYNLPQPLLPLTRDRLSRMLVDAMDLDEAENDVSHTPPGSPELLSQRPASSLVIRPGTPCLDFGVFQGANLALDHPSMLSQRPSSPPNLSITPRLDLATGVLHRPGLGLGIYDEADLEVPQHNTNVSSNTVNSEPPLHTWALDAYLPPRSSQVPPVSGENVSSEEDGDTDDEDADTPKCQRDCCKENPKEAMAVTDDLGSSPPTAGSPSSTGSGSPIYEEQQFVSSPRSPFFGEEEADATEDAPEVTLEDAAFEDVALEDAPELNNNDDSTTPSLTSSMEAQKGSDASSPSDSPPRLPKELYGRIHEINHYHSTLRAELTKHKNLHHKKCAAILMVISALEAKAKSLLSGAPTLNPNNLLWLQGFNGLLLRINEEKRKMKAGLRQMEDQLMEKLKEYDEECARSRDKASDDLSRWFHEVGFREVGDMDAPIVLPLRGDFYGGRKGSTKGLMEMMAVY